MPRRVFYESIFSCTDAFWHNFPDFACHLRQASKSTLRELQDFEVEDPGIDMDMNVDIAPSPPVPTKRDSAKLYLEM